ncbi:MAG TPA: hypothetical protein VIC32_07355 [Terriglobales bacterium]
MSALPTPAIPQSQPAPPIYTRGLALVAGMASGVSGFEVAYEHYRGSYSNKIMWAPVILSQVVGGAGVAAALRPTPVFKAVLQVSSATTLAFCATGFIFHLRGISRKPGGWGLIIPNVAMGPPPFAPLLFGMAAYIGLLADSPRLARHLPVITGCCALASGTEALYSHYKNNFRYLAQWSPIVSALFLAAAAFKYRRVLPAASATAIGVGHLGLFYHARGVLRRPGGRKNLMYNIMYGPPILAPLLFASCGFLGALCCLLRRRE